MIDFTNCEINKYKYYGGINGGKICIIYNNEEYMLEGALRRSVPHGGRVMG